MNTIMECQNLTFSHPGKSVLKNFDCAIEKGELVALFGPSGCGKTSLLRLFAGLVQPEGGAIYLRGEKVADANTFVKPEIRRLGFVFQSFALFEKVTIKKNIFYGCKTQEDHQRAEELIGLMNLPSHLEKYPHQLSGGEKQKVALVRTLALQPDILLLDEPFSNIDPSQTDFLIGEMKSLFKELGVTALMVTHSPQVSQLFADRTIQMKC